MSVREIADFQLKPGTGDLFEEKVRSWMHIFREQPTCGLFEIHRPVEDPDRVFLIIEWGTVEDHTEVFAGSEHYGPFVADIEPLYARPCYVVHSVITFSEDLG